MSRNKLLVSWSQHHQRLRASAQSRSWAGAIKRSSVRASLTTEPTWAAASVSIRTSSSRKTRERLISVFSGFTEVFKARMVLYLFHRNRTHPLGHQTGKTFMQAHAEGANTLRAEPQRGRQYQVGPVRLQQVSGTHVGLKALGDQGDDVHQSLGRLAAL